MKSAKLPGEKIFIGVIHLRPLPGSPNFRGTFDEIIKSALVDARAFENGGADAVIIENFGDIPFTKASVPPESIAAMAVAGRAVRETIKLPIGFNVLRNDAHAALALAASCGGSFIRVNILSGAMVTDQGIIEGKAFEVLRLRKALCPNVEIFADVHVKHAAPLAPLPIEITARDTEERALADGLVVSGTGTGVATDVGDVEKVRTACPKAKILIGSGITAENVSSYLRFASGVIVGSSLKKNGQLSNPVDEKRVMTLRKAIEK